MNIARSTRLGSKTIDSINKRSSITVQYLDAKIRRVLSCGAQDRRPGRICTPQRGEAYLVCHHLRNPSSIQNTHTCEEGIRTKCVHSGKAPRCHMSCGREPHGRLFPAALRLRPPLHVSSTNQSHRRRSNHARVCQVLISRGRAGRLQRQLSMTFVAAKICFLYSETSLRSFRGELKVALFEPLKSNGTAQPSGTTAVASVRSERRVRVLKHLEHSWSYSIIRGYVDVSTGHFGDIHPGYAQAHTGHVHVHAGYMGPNIAYIDTALSDGSTYNWK